MNRLPSFLRFVIILILFGCGTPISAQMAPVALEETYVEYVPVQGPISLESQYVVIRLKKNTYIVVADLQLYNRGPKTRKWVGLTKVGSGPVPWGPRRDYCNYDFISFTALVNGRKVDFLEDCVLVNCAGRSSHGCPRGTNESRWLVNHLTFPAHSMLSIRLIYEVGYKRNPSGKKLYFSLGIGRLWMGNIGKAVIRIDSSAIDGMGDISCKFPWFPHAPKPKRISENVLEYTMINFAPPDKALLRLHISRGKKVIDKQ